MVLPQDFKDKMKSLLKDDFDEFLKGYDKDNFYSLRINTLKADVETVINKNIFSFSPVKWCPTGFYYPGNERPGRHSYHHAGVFYIQEASAMAVVECADIQQGDKVLDLCAAPGGKSTQIAAKLGGTGLQINNEIVPNRAKILSQNIERMGIKNAIVTNESPEKLEKVFPSFFDKIIVDAPCSGEGMFRKDPAVVNEWSLSQVEVCANRQEHILESAHKMLAENGILVYSTCTFSPEENEITVKKFVDKHPEYIFIKPEVHKYFSPGVPEWADSSNRDLECTMRLFPHKIDGEGHFIAVLKKTVGNASKVKTAKNTADRKLLQPYFDFEKKFLKDISFDNFTLFGENLYAMPQSAPDLSKVKVLRCGLHLGEIKKGRFEPSHSLAMALTKDNVKQFVNYPCDSEEMLQFLKGETLLTDSDFKGWCLVCTDGYSVGWGKVSDGTIKNHYPKGLRIMVG
ncbi:MAG: RsmB/NOP family class I SAM-dependent RNA methyltransferase [Oscillospiraceae bacterium]|nr:RsmB/NOP family class I SAM-dependent RNA methyltransferase [Oscillospiraceae bacterium]MBQ5323841.1 RsmB/NOP family class I SAM-dependent RNA methyltransferase [Oscillospiraceae bacterium]